MCAGCNANHVHVAVLRISLCQPNTRAETLSQGRSRTNSRLALALARLAPPARRDTLRAGPLNKFHLHSLTQELNISLSLSLKTDTRGARRSLLPPLASPHTSSHTCASRAATRRLTRCAHTSPPAIPAPAQRHRDRSTPHTRTKKRRAHTMYQHTTCGDAAAASSSSRKPTERAHDGHRMGGRPLPPCCACLLLWRAERRLSLTQLHSLSSSSCRAIITCCGPNSESRGGRSGSRRTYLPSSYRAGRSADPPACPR